MRRLLPLLLIVPIVLAEPPEPVGEVISGEVVFTEGPEIEVYNEGRLTVVEGSIPGLDGLAVRQSGSALVLDLPAPESPEGFSEERGVGFVDRVLLRPRRDRPGCELRVLLWPGEYSYRAERHGEEYRLEIGDLYGTNPNELIPDANFERLRIRRVVIDPGHGGEHIGTGSWSGRNYEKHEVLPISLYLARMLEHHLGLEVILTRSDDTTIGLSGRMLMANRADADLFISIHLNGHSNTHAHGAETFYLAEAQNTETRALAQLENADFALDPDLPPEAAGDELSLILGSLIQNEYLEESQRLANCVQKSLLDYLGCFDRGVKQANFHVMREAQMPSILVEVGFLTNETEEALLIDPAYQHEAAYAIYRGIARFKEEYERGLME